MIKSSSKQPVTIPHQKPPTSQSQEPVPQSPTALGAPQPWHTVPAADVLVRLSSGHSGLSSEEAEKRLAVYGPNELRRVKGPSPWTIFLGQFKSALIIILIIATVISAFLGHAAESIAILVIVLFAVVLGFVQEFRAERALEALKEMAAPTATVLRDGQEREIPAKELVPGDIVLLWAGTKVPADARVIESINLQLEESVLTGESVPVQKRADALRDAQLALGERNNIVYGGTAVTYGRGSAVIIAIGMDTEFGKITSMLQSVEITKTPLQENLDRVGRILAAAALVIVALIVGLGVLRNAPLLEIFIFGVALAVAVVPEALPAVVTISLSIGVQRMVKRHALIRHLPAVETLGSTSVICADKTGTLTKDQMTVRQLYVNGEFVGVTGVGYEPRGTFTHEGAQLPPSELVMALLRAAALASDARLEHTNGEWMIKGDPTEGALVVAAHKAGVEKDTLEQTTPRVDEIPFTSERRRMTTFHETRHGVEAYSKGAPEVIIASCTHYLTEGGEQAIDDLAADSTRAAAKEMAAGALRVLAVARKTGATDRTENDMVFLGLIGMIDPPRPEAKTAIETCRRAGIKPVMITGDHPATAKAVAQELGLLTTGLVVTGTEIDAMSDADLQRLVHNVDVFARVSPAHKLKVVSAWQHQGQVVAMTGDGVNDAPALKKADVGVAMGITGTDVSREAAAMILTDDNFASIVGAVEEGRGIFGNIKKYLMYLLSSNIGEIGLMAGATIAGLPLPLTAVQILYVNLATDGLPALALSVDPPEDGLMNQPPRDPRSGIFSRPVVILMLVGGLWSTVVNLGLFMWALDSERRLEHAMTMTFVSLVLIQFFKAYNFRSDRVSVLARPFANKWLNRAIGWEVLLLSTVIYLPLLQQPFGTHSLSLHDWGIIAGLAVTIVPVLELAKWMLRRGWFGRSQGPSVTT